MPTHPRERPPPNNTKALLPGPWPMWPACPACHFSQHAQLHTLHDACPACPSSVCVCSAAHTAPRAHARPASGTRHSAPITDDAGAARGRCLVLPVPDELGERDERRALGGLKAVQLRDGLVDEVLRHLPALLNAQQLGVRGLVHRQVLGGGLAQLLRGGGHVQDVVHHLEREPDVARVLAQLLDRRVVRAADERAAHDRGLEQRGGLVLVDVL
mmetsp:Transcript_19346/g.49218  ORF Transcript_19346/g.49218 Transcript_19346/m.49218 type:complete len:214 (-) Transcript_19346:873-1514(-)